MSNTCLIVKNHYPKFSVIICICRLFSCWMDVFICSISFFSFSLQYFISKLTLGTNGWMQREGKKNSITFFRFSLCFSPSTPQQKPPGRRGFKIIFFNFYFFFAFCFLLCVQDQGGCYNNSNDSEQDRNRSETYFSLECWIRSSPKANIQQTRGGGGNQQ